MRSVKSKGTYPEKKVIELIRKLGYRCRRPLARTPGNPDIIVPELNIAIFVNGCFWHRHRKCKEATMPATNIEYWTNKFEKNIIRDKVNIYKTKKRGWKVLTIWECETKKTDLFSKRLHKRFKSEYLEWGAFRSAQL